MHLEGAYLSIGGNEKTVIHIVFYFSNEEPCLRKAIGALLMSQVYKYHLWTLKSLQIKVLFFTSLWFLATCQKGKVVA